MQLFDRIQTADEVLNRIQDRLKSVINAIAGKPIIDGQLLEGVDVTSAAVTPVPHKLGRVPRGMVVTQATDYVFQTQAPDSKFLYLQTVAIVTGGAIKINLWVF